MKALSIRQPWAWLILHAGKNAENRTWKTNLRGQILIHAGQEFDFTGLQWLTCSTFAHYIGRMPATPNDYERGGIVGTADIVDCVTAMDSPWFFGPYGFVLRDPRPLPFVSVRGRLGFFEVEESP